jgi:hypothetical protein
LEEMRLKLPMRLKNFKIQPIERKHSRGDSPTVTSTNTTDNPLLKATRAAFKELTTPEAQRWYRQQLQTSAAIAHQGFILVRHVIHSSRKDIAAVSQTSEAIALTEATAPAQAEAPAVWLALEANSGVVHEPVQAIAPFEVSSEAAELGPEHPPSVWAATEMNDHETASADEGLEDSLDPTMGTGDEPLPDREIPFDEELECSPLFLEEEEDTSFFSHEEVESTDDTLNESKDPNASLPASDLSAMIQAYMQKNSVSSESSDEDAIAHPSPALGSPSEAAAFAWKEHHPVSESADGADAGE